MRLTTEEMTAWATQFYGRLGEKVNWSKVARDAEFVPVTFNVQRTRNQVDPQVIINIARKYGLNPLDELARIPRWEHLISTRSSPSQQEIVTSLHPAYVLQELADRLLGRASNYPDFESWEGYYGTFSTWVDVAGSEIARERLRAALHLGSKTALSNKLNSRSRFAVDEAIDGFTAAGMDPVYALVLASLITAEEAGYPETIRQDALLSISNEDLLYLCQRQVRYTSRILAEQQLSKDYLKIMG